MAGLAFAWAMAERRPEYGRKGDAATRFSDVCPTPFLPCLHDTTSYLSHFCPVCPRGKDGRPGVIVVIVRRLFYVNEGRQVA